MRWAWETRAPLQEDERGTSSNRFCGTGLLTRDPIPHGSGDPCHDKQTEANFRDFAYHPGVYAKPDTPRRYAPPLSSRNDAIGIGWNLRSAQVFRLSVNQPARSAGSTFQWLVVGASSLATQDVHCREQARSHKSDCIVPAPEGIFADSLFGSPLERGARRAGCGRMSASPCIHATAFRHTLQKKRLSRRRGARFFRNYEPP